jgi:hypothetical protein
MMSLEDVCEGLEEIREFKSRLVKFGEKCELHMLYAKSVRFEML